MLPTERTQDRILAQVRSEPLDALLSSGLGERYLVVPCDMPALVADDLRASRHPGELVTFGRPTAVRPPASDADLRRTRDDSACLASTDRRRGLPDRRRGPYGRASPNVCSTSIRPRNGPYGADHDAATDRRRIRPVCP